MEKQNRQIKKKNTDSREKIRVSGEKRKGESDRKARNRRVKLQRIETQTRFERD